MVGDERAGLTQEEAAELLGVRRQAVTRAETRKRTGAVTGALEYLVASWVELNEDARRRVRTRLADMRRSRADEQGDPEEADETE